MEKIIIEYPDYTVDERGNIFSYKRKKYPMKLCPCTNKYLSVVLSKKGTQKRHLVHRLVAIAFIPNPENFREVNHKDGIITNNKVDNLEWVSPKMNMRHAVKNGFHKASFGEDAGQSKLTDTLVLELRNKYMSGLFTVRQLAKDMDMNHSAIWCAITGRTWKHVKTIELLKQEQL